LETASFSNVGSHIFEPSTSLNIDTMCSDGVPLTPKCSTLNGTEHLSLCWSLFSVFVWLHLFAS